MKKKLFYFIAISVFSVSVYAQDSFNATEYAINTPNSALWKSTIDTIKPPSNSLPCYSFFTYENSSGYVTGTNTSGDTMYAQVYKNTNNKVCLGFVALVVVKSGQGNFTGKLYSVQNNTPDTLMGTTVSMSSSDMPGAFGFIGLAFDSPVPITSDFAAVLGFSSQNINCGILGTYDNCVAAGYERLSFAGDQTGQWITIKDKYGLDVDLHVYPILNDNNVGIKESPLALKVSIYPNPANSLVTIVSLERIEKLQVYNLTGQLIHEENPNELVAKIAVDSWLNGNYIVKLYTNKGIISKKLTVFR